ncbi:GIP [Symbiodinium sp. CCMP2456]|nr:GIP [Symbiodinium sp. CCMP2456]
MSRQDAVNIPVPEPDEGEYLEEQADGGSDEEADYEQFQRWMQFRERDRRSEWRGHRPREQSRRGRDDEDDDQGDLRANAGPPPPWDGQESPFEDYLIRARIWVGTTKARGRTRGPLLLKALSGTPFQDFKHLAKDAKWLTDPDNAEQLLSQMDTPEYYGDDKDEHLLASLSRITYHLKRSRTESARQFLGRWEAAERKVLEHKVNLPPIYKGFLLINALGLSEPDTKALLNFTQGSIEPKDVKHWLRKHETKLQANQLGNESANRTGKATGSAVHMMEEIPEENGDQAVTGPDDEEIDLMEAMLADLVEDEETEPGPFEEQEVAEILSMMIKEKKKTYTQSAQLKKDKELGRGYRNGTGFNSRSVSGPIRPGHYKLSIAELKQRTRCKKCGKIGHWQRECPGTTGTGQAASTKETHLLEVDLQDYDDAMFCHYLETVPKPGAGGAVLNEDFEPKGYGHNRDSPISELDYMFRPCHEDAMDCSSPTNKRARPEGADGAKTARALDAWRNLLLRLALIFRPMVRLMVNLVEGSLDRSFQQVKNNVHAYHLAHLEELRRVVDDAIKDKTDQDRELFHKFQNWKREKKSQGPPSGTEAGFEMVEKRSASSSAYFPLPDSISEYTHYNVKTGNRGKRVTAARTGSPPCGPPPPVPLNQNIKPSSSGGTSHYASPSLSSSPTMEKVTDKMKQQEVFTFGAQLFGIDLPQCNCGLVCKMELSQTQANHQRVFVNCCKRNEKEQCGVFRWCEKQPLLDEEFRVTRDRVRSEITEDHTPREFLVRMIQDLCGHSSTIRTGTNAFVNRVRCRTCHKLLTNETKSPSESKNPKTENNMVGASLGPAPTEASDESSSHQADYQEFLAWRRLQHCGVHCDPYEPGGLSRNEVAELGETEGKGSDMSVLYVSNIPQCFLECLHHALDTKCACLVFVLPPKPEHNHEEDVIMRLVRQGSAKAVRDGAKVVCVQEGPEDVSQFEHLPERSRFGGMHFATNWSTVTRAPGRSNPVNVGAFLGLVRCLLAGCYGVDVNTIYVRDVVKDVQEQGERLRRYQDYTHQAIDENEVHFQRRDNQYQIHPKMKAIKGVNDHYQATTEVIKIAQEMRCSVCEKFLQTRPPRRAAPPREVGINEVIGMDTVWIPTVGQKRKKIALNIIDYASHFQMIIPLKGRSPEAVWTAYRQWVRFFGPPKQIWADQGGEFKGSFRTRTIQEGTRLEPSSLESPFQRGLAERHGKTFKVILEKIMADYCFSNLAEWHELVDTAAMMKNRLASRGGFSPVQRVIGYLPRLPGGLLSEGQDDAETSKPNRLGDGGLARSMAMRKAAAKAFFEVDCDQALRNVLAGGPRPQHDYVVGQMVYFYRLGHSKKGDRPHERWHGPARVIMTDLPSTLWLSYQGNLVKASPERVRPGSEEEKMTIHGWLDGLAQAKEEFEKEPKRGYMDLTHQGAPPGAGRDGTE